MNRLLFPLLLVIATTTYAQSTRLSGDAEIRLITCGPGQAELYAAFGHSAYRVYDPSQNIDLVYNYGVFDFDQPNFYLNFARGNLNYKLAKHDYSQFLGYYISTNRSFDEQPLSLNPAQKQKLFEYLEWNVLPENQYYQYDYFYDNCATRIELALTEALGDQVSFDFSFITDEKTIRQLTDDYLGEQPWGDLGIDICLGLPMDRVATPQIHLFLPDYVSQAFEHASIRDNGTSKPLVATKLNVNVPKYRPKTEMFFTPYQVFWALFILGMIMSLLDLIRGRRKLWLDVVIYFLTGIMGVFLFLLWVATDHAAAANNLNLAWALPFNLVGVYFLLKKHRYTARYFKWLTFWYLLLAVFWFLLPQQLHSALFPFVLLILVRSYLSWRQSISYA